MPVVAVINHKGGSGKSTLSSHIAAWFAKSGCSVMLGDVDRQQSSASWLRRRDPCMPTISPWSIDQKNIRRVPQGVTHAVLDTPGGLHGFELARVVMFADIILMPVGYGVFDREAAAACYAELCTLPKIASGKCPVAAVGMRFDGNPQSKNDLTAWADRLGIVLLGALRETSLYVRSQDFGQTIFDLSNQQAAADLAQWEPILRWLQQGLRADRPQAFTALDARPVTGQAAKLSITGSSMPLPTTPEVGDNVRTLIRPLPTPASTAPTSVALADNLMPRQMSLVHGGARLSSNEPGRTSPVPLEAPARQAVRRHASLLDALHIPEFLRRKR
jgi:chromosome partitioning protein